MCYFMSFATTIYDRKIEKCLTECTMTRKWHIGLVGGEGAWGGCCLLQCNQQKRHQKCSARRYIMRKSGFVALRSDSYIHLFIFPPIKAEWSAVEEVENEFEPIYKWVLFGGWVQLYSQLLMLLATLILRII